MGAAHFEVALCVDVQGGIRSLVCLNILVFKQETCAFRYPLDFCMLLATPDCT